MKKYLLSLSLLFIGMFSASAQFKYNMFAATLNVGANRANMDAGYGDVNFSIGFSGDVHITPFTFLSLNVNDGKFSKNKPDQYGRGFEADFTSFNSTVNMSLGEILRPWWKETYGFWNNLYLGAGIGVVKSKMNDFNYITNDGGGKFPSIGGVKYSGTNVIIPLNAGLNIKFVEYGDETPIELNVNYQHNIALTDNIDGYNPRYDNKYSDSFGLLTLGLRVNFGPQRTYYSWR
ncbi:hypothetical protein [Solitalea lacus]|uniref:hypothetical protein n=1 Tax=Solitalea lacus TaxID=2911172 RepID=UPI001EDB9A69|nr:hypothetical protein [Solitalea lacus]UKJ07085.1 hypothetical protein L2B55_16335 [Solitalea lacus]